MKQARGRRQQSSGAESLQESSPSRSNCSCRKPYTLAAVPQTKHLSLYQPLTLPTLPSIFPYANPTSSATTRKNTSKIARRGTFRGISPIFQTRHATMTIPLRVAVSATGSSSGDLSFRGFSGVSFRDLLRSSLGLVLPRTPNTRPFQKHQTLPSHSENIRPLPKIPNHTQHPNPSKNIPRTFRDLPTRHSHKTVCSIVHCGIGGRHLVGQYGRDACTGVWNLLDFL